MIGLCSNPEPGANHHVSQVFKVLIVSSNHRLQAVLPTMIEREALLEYQGCVSSVSEAMAHAFANVPDVVVSDLPPANATEVLAWRAVRESGARIVMLTRYMHEGADLRAALAGSAGLILVPERRLVESVLQVARGDLLRSAELEGRLRAIASGEAPSALDAHGRRVLDLITDGHSDGDIAARLASTPDAVREQIVRIAESLV